MENNEFNNEEEISLIDLFAVLLHYRKLIIIGTLICTFIFSLKLFVVPAVNKKASKKTVDITYTVKLNNLPATVNSRINDFTVNQAFNFYMTSKQFIASEYKKNPFLDSETKNEMSDLDFNLFIEHLLKDKKYEVKTTPISTVREIHMIVPMANITVADSFVKSILQQAEATMQEVAMPAIQTVKLNTEKSLQQVNSSYTTINDAGSVINLQRTLDDIQTFLSNFKCFIELNEQSFAVPVAQGRVKSLVIVFFASAFVFVFIAFLLNALKNIKNDPQAYGKLKDAWKEGR